MPGTPMGSRPPSQAGGAQDGPRWPLSSLELEDLLEELRSRAGTARESQERLASLLDAVVAISSDLDLAEVLERIVLSACHLVDASYGALGVLGPGGEELVEFVTHGLSQSQRAAIGPLPTGHGLLGTLITTPHPQRAKDIAGHPDSRGFPPHHPAMTSFLGAPVRIRDQVFGNLYLTDKRSAEEFSADDETVLVALAAAAGVAIDNARHFERARTQQLWGEVIREATQSLLAGGSHGEVLDGVAHRVRALTAASACTIGLTRDPDLLVAASTAVPSDGAAFVGSVGERLTDADVRAALLAEGRITSGGSATRALVPMTLGPAPLGILVIDWDEGVRPTELSVLTEFGLNLTVALEAASARTERARSDLYEDRDRIARDMHDHVIQRLFATGMSLQSVSRISDGKLRDTLDVAVDELDATIRDIRHAIFALHRSPGARPLTTEIATICRDAAVTLGFAPDLRLTGQTADIPELLAGDLLAVLREALSNVARHAAASAVQVAVTVAADVTVVVCDDGRGVPPEVARSGLDNLSRRAERRGGSLAVEPRAPSGSTITWRVPLEGSGNGG